MAADAGLLRAVSREIANTLSDRRIDRISQPDRFEFIFSFRLDRSGADLLVNVGSESPRINISRLQFENPPSPPTFCMYLRKYFTGARLISVSQPGYERILRFTFDCRDDMGYRSEKNIIIEIMGRYSNLIITDEEDKILNVLKPIDFSDSLIRQLLPGMRYTSPPAQDKLDPSDGGTADRLREAERASDRENTAAGRFLSDRIFGLSSGNIKEAVFRSSSDVYSPLSECRDLPGTIEGIVKESTDGTGTPCISCRPDGKFTEYSFTRLTYRESMGETLLVFPTVSEMLDRFFEKKQYEEIIARKSNDIRKVIGNSRSRILKKLEIQRADLRKCEDRDRLKMYGDLITANIYRLERGMDKAELENYYGDYEPVTVKLDPRLTPSQNAQAYYRKYNKAKSAMTHLTEQIRLGEEEYEYIMTVEDALSRAVTEKEVSDIREELVSGGYLTKKLSKPDRKNKVYSIVTLEPDRYHTVYCGKNNIANDVLTTKIASRFDIWFHVKNVPGSHTVLRLVNASDSPSEELIRTCAEIAVYFSSARDNSNVPVDYARISDVKKPSGSRPGYVTFRNNKTVFATADPEKIDKMIVRTTHHI